MCSRWRGISPGVIVAWTLVIALITQWATGSLRAVESPPSQIVVRLSGELFAPLIERPIDDVLSVDEVILGVRAIGQAHVLGQPQLTLAEDPSAASFRVTVTGTIASRTVGRKGPVEIHSHSDTRFTATKRVTFQPGRGFVPEPAQITAQTSSQTDAIEPVRQGVLGQMIERRAWTRVAQSRHQVNQIVQAKAEAKIREAFDRLLESRLARLNRRVDQRYLFAAIVGGQGAPQYRCCTKDETLVIAVSSGAARSDWAKVEAIGRSHSGPPVQLWVHEQVIGDRLASLLRRVDLTRRLVFQPSIYPPSLSYDFAATGDWFVVQSAGWSVSGATASPHAETTVAEAGGTTRFAGVGGGQ